MNPRTFLPLLLCVCTAFVPVHAADSGKTWALAIHGGAGVIERGDLTADKEIAYRAVPDVLMKVDPHVDPAIP